jgi:hypothetical protein
MQHTAPESSAADSGKPQYRLFSTAGVVLSALFGSLLAGGILVAINYHRLRRPAAAKGTILLILLAQIIFLALLVRIFPGSDNPMPRLIYLAMSPIIMYFVVHAVQGASL